MSFLLKRKLGEQEDGEDSDHGERWCNEGDEVDERGEGSEEDQGNEGDKGDKGDKVDEVRHRPLSGVPATVTLRLVSSLSRNICLSDSKVVELS